VGKKKVSKENRKILKRGARLKFVPP